MKKIRFRDFVLTPEEKIVLFDKYAQESGRNSLKALRTSNRGFRSGNEMEVPPLSPAQVSRDLARPVEFKHDGQIFMADGDDIKKKETGPENH